MNIKILKIVIMYVVFQCTNNIVFYYSKQYIILYMNCLQFFYLVYIIQINIDFNNIYDLIGYIVHTCLGRQPNSHIRTYGSNYISKALNTFYNK